MLLKWVNRFVVRIYEPLKCSLTATFKRGSTNSQHHSPILLSNNSPAPAPGQWTRLFRPGCIDPVV
eukprot:5052163-Pyramimonas_sp.AAC.1